MTFTLFESLTLTEAEKKRRIDKEFWDQREVDPMIKMRWNAAIEVEPGNKDKNHPGVRIFPDGIREVFRFS